MPQIIIFPDANPICARGNDEETVSVFTRNIPMSKHLLLIADDLTGANDSSVTFAAAGFSTLLALSPATLPQTLSHSAEVFAVSTDSRAQSDAHSRTAQAAQAALQQGIARLYLKIDSTMRGSVRAQIAGALHTWQTRHPHAVAIICPAYPAMGRTIEHGQLLVHGIPVPETPSGQDAICPVSSADMHTLLPEAIVLPCAEASALAEHIRSSGARQIVIDAQSETDLQQIAQAIALLGEAAIPVGSAGLARAIAHTLPAPAASSLSNPLPVTPPVLVLVTSIHDTSQQQVDTYLAHQGASATVFSPYPAQLLAPHSQPALLAQMDALLNSDQAQHTLVIRANPARIASGSSAEALAQTFAQKLAALGKACLQKRRFGALIMFGGDGSAAMLEALNVTALRVLRPLIEGVPLATVLGGEYDGLVVITKSGGFGSPDLLGRTLTLLTDKENS